jgi:hypothetical protein
MTMAIGDIGIFNPAESAYSKPGAYDDALRADAVKRASYLAMMDQFYEQLDETKREFDQTLTFKQSALAQDKWIAEQQIGLSKEELQLKREQGSADLALRSRMLDETIRSDQANESIKRLDINSRTSSEGSEDRAFDFLEKYMTKGGGSSPYLSLEGKPIFSGSTSPGTGIELPSGSPESREIDQWWNNPMNAW